MEKPKGLYAYMPAELKLNLFNLTEDNIKEKKNIEETKNEKNESKTMFDAFDKFIINTANSFFDESNFSEEDMERMFVNITNKMKAGKEETPTIDEILDKISNKGIESLSLTERKILDEYSNN
jgi:tRNA C32,U32 (ribose-2'-O)-methylase TrmJ